MQLKVHQVELTSENHKREQMKQIQDLEHYLTQDDGFRRLVWEANHIRPGRQRRQPPENFWTGVHNGCHVRDLDALRSRSFALNEYLCILDELNEVSARPDFLEVSSRERSLRNQMLRSSAVSGMGDLAPGQARANVLTYQEVFYMKSLSGAYHLW
jgi:hypothetical protein